MALRRLGPAQRVCPVRRGIEPDRAHPPLNDPRVLTRGEMCRHGKPAAEEVVRERNLVTADEFARSPPGLLGDLQLDRRAGLLLNDDGAVSSFPTQAEPSVGGHSYVCAMPHGAQLGHPDRQATKCPNT